MKKVLLVVVLTMAMVVGLIGCGNKSNSGTNATPTSAGTDSGSNSGTNSGTDSSTDAGTDSSAIDTSEHVVITYMTTGDAPTNGATEEVLAKLNEILTEKVNAELQIYYISWTDWLSNYNLTLAQMDGTVDLVGTATDWLDAWPNTQKGAFLPLSEDMLQTYAPQTWASVTQDHWNMCKYDGEIYLMPEDNYAQWINHGFMYRNDWATAAGLDGVHSWADLTKYFEYVKATYPDVIPWDSDGSAYLASGYIQSNSNYVAIDGLSVPIFGTTQSDLYTVYSPFYEGDALVEYAKLMKQWDELGVWKTDVLNNSADNREEFYLGETAVDQHHTETWYGTVKPKMDEQQPGSDVGFFYFGEESQNLVKLSITHGAMAISAASKNPERALMVYDLLRNDPECYNLINIGLEGVQYEVVDDGYYQRPASYTDEANGITTNYWWGRNDSIALKYAGRAWSDYEELTAIYKTFAIDYPYGQVVWSQDNFTSQISNISDIYNEYMPKICFGKFDDAESIVAEFRAKLQAAGIEDVIADLQTQMDAFKAAQ